MLEENLLEDKIKNEAIQLRDPILETQKKLFDQKSIAILKKQLFMQEHFYSLLSYQIKNKNFESLYNFFNTKDVLDAITKYPELKSYCDYYKKEIKAIQKINFLLYKRLKKLQERKKYVTFVSLQNRKVLLKGKITSVTPYKYSSSRATYVWVGNQGADLRFLDYRSKKKIVSQKKYCYSLALLRIIECLYPEKNWTASKYRNFKMRFFKKFRYLCKDIKQASSKMPNIHKERIQERLRLALFSHILKLAKNPSDSKYLDPLLKNFGKLYITRKKRKYFEALLKEYGKKF